MEGRKGDDKGSCGSKRVEMQVEVRLLLCCLKAADEDLSVGNEGRKMQQQGWGRCGSRDGRGEREIAAAKEGSDGNDYYRGGWEMAATNDDDDDINCYGDDDKGSSCGITA
ncbi:hypothetical protein B296_00045894 [Ensete ventricosum]|uniref:Uncharacterized protein n=1 Tax=Ensete ventricosum TaxID=4639 RepID=A0A426XK20_ENSVE|nr:hypothetical protein B296_00045894 [Ensete ventricosum]